MRSILRGLCPVLLALAGSALADLGALNGVVTLGEDGAWRGAMTGQGYRLTNEMDPGAIRYYYGPHDSTQDGRRTVELRVDVSGATPDGRAGLLYGFDAQTRHYFLVVMGPRGEVDVFRRDADGLSRIMGSVLDRAQPVATLRVTEQGPNVTVTVDDQRVASFESAGTGRGATGIAAMGAGDFLFSSYRESSGTGAVAATTVSPDASGTVAPPDRWTERILRDEFGFEQPVDAYRISLPPDWRVNGGVQWYGEAACQLDSNKLHLMATSPDGTQRVEFIPGGSWSWLSLYDAMPQLRQDSFSGCSVRRILDAQSFVDEYLPAIRPGATLVNSRARPDLAQEIRQFAGDMAASPGQRFQIEVLELTIRYTADGKQVEETLLPSLLFSTMPGPDPYGGMNGVTLVAQALGTVAGARVGGPVDDELVLAIAQSVAMLPAYQQRLARYYQQKTELMASALRRRQAAQRQYIAARRAASASSGAAATTGSDVLDIQFDGWKKRDAMTSAGQSRSVDGIAERDAYTNTYGQVVYMPSQYRRAYQLPNEVYVGTNDAFFNPVEQTGQFGEQLRRYDYER